MTTSRLTGVTVTLGVLGLLAAGCISYHRAGASHRVTHVSHDVYVHGSSFRLGGGYYRVLYHPRSRHYYFRARSLRGHPRHCSSFCFRDDGYHYHHAGCRHLQGHVRRFGFRVGMLIRRYGPSLP